MNSGTERRKGQAATLSLAYNLGATALKIAAASLTGSVSLISEAVHSATDVVASFIAFVSVRAAAVPPDEEHNYGHGKIESLAGFAESIFLLLVVGYIGVEAVQNLLSPQPSSQLGIGIWVMVLSSLTSVLVGTYVTKVGRETESLALQSNGQHLMVDFWTSLGVLAALIITKFTGWKAADPLFALAFCAWIAWNAIHMANEGFHQLIDRRITDSEVERIKAVVEAEPNVLSYHRLRTRHSGNEHFVDLHVVVPRDWSVVQAHDLADRLEKQIQAALPPCKAVIHVDPFDPLKAIEAPPAP